ncbi:P-loop containing nucleoside triphosphate hydrolase protein [Coniella lustricola]|uniref:P-loop containing nucleoside triphosphate hydrolase protein n=1 Tax=Coniella lustricola TaxID=2025994 RepID=A0A2T3A586_9PEZI|nr:P-loop containing nucleoside triphosphate hydrolase protein [Coniella lustricola]
MRDANTSTSTSTWNQISAFTQPSKNTTDAVHGLSDIWNNGSSGDYKSPALALGKELVSTFAAELDAPAPLMRATKDPKRRPISLLYVHNYKGSRLADDIVNHVGRELDADVIHLNAAKLAKIVAPYLGSTLYFGRGNMSMLGYSAAQANGRSAYKTDSNSGGDDDIVLRGMSVMKFLQPTDDRATWDDLKLTHIVKEIANAANTKRKADNGSTSKPERTIIHIHNYVELAMTQEGTSIINRLRTIADRRWQDGSKIIIVGSVSNDASASTQWHAKVKELSEQDCYPIVTSVKPDVLPELQQWQRVDYLHDNLLNIEWMLECLRAEHTTVNLLSGDDGVKTNSSVQELATTLSGSICSNHWIYRLVTQAIGLHRGNDGPLDILTLAEALEHMKRVDQARASILGVGSTPSYKSLTASKPATASMLDDLISLGHAPSDTSSSTRKNPKDMNLDDEEKKLLSGLVNVEDIQTTFDEVIAPPEVRESLVSLTTLSLRHPKAFSYGVLARERIHGALLYGPPGTGKTLMAKALAKGSGANMLEISAASINDMWVGNSEKNVRAVFSLARKMSPMVVFLDEADALLGARGRQPNRGGYRETINQFLREWDGLSNSLNTQQVFILVSTNRPQDMDEAVLRRLPRRILVDLPLKDARLAILQSLLRGEALDDSVSMDKLATETELYSGSDLKSLAVAAAMEAVKEQLATRDTQAAASADVGGSADHELQEKRVLTRRHFDKALKDITASISEDMQSLKALRKFDAQYGDARRKKKKSHMGFEVAPPTVSSEEVRVRNK